MNDENKNVVEEVVESVAETFADMLITRLKWAGIAIAVLIVLVVFFTIFK